MRRVVKGEQNVKAVRLPVGDDARVELKRNYEDENSANPRGRVHREQRK
ncbi:hypothetical protein M1N91_01700 [Dehalococcoidia bacterium]|nr:hypothetical protein [Dehalococcoidia bacterium]